MKIICDRSAKLNETRSTFIGLEWVWREIKTHCGAELEYTCSAPKEGGGVSFPIHNLANHANCVGDAREGIDV